MAHTVQPIEPSPPPTVVVIETTSTEDFDNPPDNVVYVAPGYTPED